MKKQSIFKVFFNSLIGREGAGEAIVAWMFVAVIIGVAVLCNWIATIYYS
jgi:hypothetical protein